MDTGTVDRLAEMVLTPALSKNISPLSEVAGKWAENGHWNAILNNANRLQRFSVCHPEQSEGSTWSDAAPCGFAKLCIVAVPYINR
jgi:hypothetical protein